MPPVFYVVVLLLYLLIGAFVTVGALVDPHIAAVGVMVLLAAPFVGMLVRDVFAGELFNPLVAVISAAVVVPVLGFPPYVVATALLSLWCVLVAAFATKTAWNWAWRLSGVQGHGKQA